MSIYQLAPSILSADFARLGEEVAAIEAGGADLIHVDVMDGHFVPNISYGAPVMKCLLGKTGLPFDVHLMIENPDLYIPDFVTENTRFITVHAEACRHLHRTIQLIKSFGIKAGVALNPATPPELLEWVLEDMDLALIMSVNPGFGGQKFIPSALEKIRRLNMWKQERNPALEIEIDGGINTGNIAEAVDAGVTIAVAGSAVFGAEDAAARVKEFKMI
ncbi:MAG: ribulose-phosphate 3-epimerase [Anaerovoracaceae bacterium]|nr:ribulose-phosphate 3-epimerase [Anaerovoracaceae bacterium]